MEKGRTGVGFCPGFPGGTLNSSEFLHYIEIIGFFVTMDLCYPHGMMECWNSGVMRIKSGKKRFAFFFLSTHHSSIPLFQYSSWGEASFGMVEKIWLSSEERLFRRSRVISETKGSSGNRPRSTGAKGQGCSPMITIFPCKIN